MTLELPGQPAPAPRELPSEQVVVASPMSFTGSAVRAWKLTRGERNGWLQAALDTGVVLLIVVWWAAVLAWYLTFGLLLVPYRLIRRGARKRKVARLRHEELLRAVYRPGSHEP